ncbi:unnamed protein product [Chrysoparadoxa australica]
MRAVFDLSDLHVTNLRGILAKVVHDGKLNRSRLSQVFNVVTGQHAQAVLNRLFEMLDTDGDGVVEVQDFLSGLSALSAGSEEDKIRAAFEVYDLNGTGSVSFDEMCSHLTSMFKVIATTSPAVFAKYGLSPQELARATTRQCFITSDLTRNGHLSFDEFKAWYNQPGREDFNDMVMRVSDRVAPEVSEGVKQLGEATGLGTLETGEALALLAAEASAEGVLGRDEFARAVAQGQRLGGDVDPAAAGGLLLAVFDEDGSGSVDFLQLAGGVSLLCVGADHDKARYVFDLYDVDKDGGITLEEMEIFIGSVRRVLKAAVQLGEMHAVQEEDVAHMAAVTARACFEEAGIGEEGTIDVAEFGCCYRQLSGKGVDMRVEVRAVWYGVVGGQGFVAEVKKVTNLGAHDVGTIFQLFATCADENGFISRPAFFGCFRALVEVNVGQSQGHGQGSDVSVHKGRVGAVLDRLFQLFDADDSGYVSFDELASGLSVLCGGRRDDKVEAAFSLFDVKEEGRMTQAEMITYLTSVFKVLLEASPDVKIDTIRKVSATQLAQATAEEAFEVAGAGGDGDCNCGYLTFEQFRDWYHTTNLGAAKEHQGEQQVPPPPPPPPPPRARGKREAAIDNAEPVTLVELRDIFGLDEAKVEAVFELFALAVNQEGFLTRERFWGCFLQLCDWEAFSLGQRRRAQVAVATLFNLFDVADQGCVDFSEIMTGLGLLCGDDMGDRVCITFELFDLNADGYVNRSEMLGCITAVNRLLEGLGANQGLALSPEQEFEAADVDRDGMLSFEEFMVWYVGLPIDAGIQDEPGNVSLASIQLVDLEEARRSTVFSQFRASSFVEHFAKSGMFFGRVPIGAFKLGLAELSPKDASDLFEIADRMFVLFDADNCGEVDCSELICGLTVLCGGNFEQRVSAAFDLCLDRDGDGYVTLEELKSYLGSVYRVLFEIQPSLSGQMKVTPETLGEVTAEEAFRTADSDGDGRITRAEFEWWYGQGGFGNQEKAGGPLWMNQHKAKQLMGLDRFHVSGLFQRLSGAADVAGKGLTKEALHLCIETILRDGGVSRSAQQQSMLSLVLSRLFDAFDEERFGCVDAVQLACGLGTLCSGSRQEKVEAAGNALDADSNGFISLYEMELFLLSVFTVFYALTPGMQQHAGGFSVAQLAEVAAKQALTDIGKTKDGSFTLKEFTTWYLTRVPKGIRPHDDMVSESSEASCEGEGDRLLGLGLDGDGPIPQAVKGMLAARMQLRLDAFSVDDLLETLSECSSAGFITQQDYLGHMGYLLQLAGETKGDAAYQEGQALALTVFQAFDKSGSGRVSLASLASGLSVLCAASTDEKVSAAYTLYDANGDGLLSFSELVSYMAGVFCLLQVLCTPPH